MNMRHESNCRRWGAADVLSAVVLGLVIGAAILAVIALVVW